MKEKLEAALAGLLERLEKTEEFVLAQAPAVLQEMVTKRLIELAMQTIQLVVGLGISSYILGLGLDAWPTTKGDMVIPVGLVIGGSGIASFILFLCIFDIISGYLQVRLCPKLFLLEELKDLVYPKSEEKKS